MTEPNKEKRDSATISAKTIEALTPMIREVNALMWSEEYFARQIPSNYLGTFILPQEKGILVAVVDACRILAIHDKEGYATRSLRVHLPDELLNAAQTKRVSLVDENGIVFEVDSQPRPHQVFCVDLFGMVTVEHKQPWQEEAFPGVFGSWHNRDYDNVRDMSSYRFEVASTKHIEDLIASLTFAAGYAEAPPYVDLTKLTAFCKAAEQFGLSFKMQFGGEDKPLVFRTEGDQILGVLMPISIVDEEGAASGEPQ